MIDFSRINVMLCCFGNERVNDLYAAAFNILMNTKNTVMDIAYNTLELSEEALLRKSLLEALATHTGNKLTWINFDESVSKAQMISAILKTYDYISVVPYTNKGTKWLLNVDDDYMIPYKTLKLFELASKVENPGVNNYVYGQFDIINYRDYEDWSAEKLELSDLFNFARENGLRCLPNHLMKEIPDELITFAMPGQSTGAYMIDTSAIKLSMLDVLDQWPKGKRGYDEFLCSAIGGVHWIYGSNSYHTDRTKAHVDGKVWKEDVFRNDLMMDGSVKGRLPSKLGEKSIPRGEKPDDAPEIPKA